MAILPERAYSIGLVEHLQRGVSPFLLGAGLSSDLLWGIADVTMGGRTLINMPVIIYLGKYALRALADYTKQRREGKVPEFKASSIGLPHDVDYWK